MRILNKMNQFIAILLILLTLYVWACHYLQVNDRPEKSDAVVLFAGPNYAKRFKEAHQLMHDGFANILIVPAYRLFFKMGDGKMIIDNNLNPFKNTFNRNAYPSVYENTHIEILEAKKAMDLLGLTSTLLVSDPLHMRRIQIISSTVLDKETYKIRNIGSRYLRQNGLRGAFSRDVFKFTVTEYVKLVYFFVYRLCK